MATTVQSVVDNAEKILHDTTNVTWSAADLAEWCSYGQAAIVTRKPDAYVKHEAFILVAGTVQSISDAVILFDITRNMGTGGSTPGNAITRINREVLDAVLPSWPAATASATVKHWMYDPKDAKRFHVYPPQPASGFGYVDGVWSALPDSIGIDDNITLDDIYRDPLLDYILFRAFSIDAAISPYAAQRATAHAQMFLNSIGSKETVEEFYAKEAAGG